MSLEHSTTVKLLTEKHLEFLSFKGGCTGLSESMPKKMPHFWKSHVVAHMFECIAKFCQSMIYFIWLMQCHSIK